MGGEDGGGTLVIGGGKGASKSDANVRVQTRSPHEDEVFAELVDAGLFAAVALFGVLFEEEFKGFAPTLAGVEVFELIIEEGWVDVGGETEEGAWISGGCRRYCTVWGWGRRARAHVNGGSRLIVSHFTT